MLCVNRALLQTSYCPGAAARDLLHKPRATVRVLHGQLQRRHFGEMRAAVDQVEGVEEERFGPSALDVRVGKILSCDRHPDADSLYIEQIDVGESEPRTICSGLVPYVEREQLMEALVVVLCNLKARNLRGVKSHGMLLCASDKDNGRVAPLVPPAEAAVGERVTVGDVTDAVPEPESENKIKKKKIWEKLQPSLKTNAEGVATFDGQPMHVPSGPITCTSLPNAPIS